MVNWRSLGLQSSQASRADASGKNIVGQRGRQIPKPVRPHIVLPTFQGTCPIHGNIATAGDEDYQLCQSRPERVKITIGGASPDSDSGTDAAGGSGAATAPGRPPLTRPIVFLLHRALLAKHSDYFGAVLRNPPATSRFREGHASAFHFPSVHDYGYDDGFFEEDGGVELEGQEEGGQHGKGKSPADTAAAACYQQDPEDPADWALFTAWLYACAACKEPQPYLSAHRCASVSASSAVASALPASILASPAPGEAHGSNASSSSAAAQATTTTSSIPAASASSPFSTGAAPDTSTTTTTASAAVLAAHLDVALRTAWCHPRAAPEAACAFADRMLSRGYERFALARVAQHAGRMDADRIAWCVAGQAVAPAPVPGRTGTGTGEEEEEEEEEGSAAQETRTDCAAANAAEPLNLSSPIRASSGLGRFMHAWVAWRRFNPALGSGRGGGLAATTSATAAARTTSPATTSPTASAGTTTTTTVGSLLSTSASAVLGLTLHYDNLHGAMRAVVVDAHPVLAAVPGWSSLDPRKYDVDHWFAEPAPAGCSDVLGVHCEHRRGLRPWSWLSDNGRPPPPRRVGGLIPRMMGDVFR